MHGVGRVLLCDEICVGLLVESQCFGWWEVDISALSAHTLEGEWRERGKGRARVTRGGDWEAAGGGGRKSSA